MFMFSSLRPYCLKQIHTKSKQDECYWKVLLRSNIYHTSISEARQCQELNNPAQNVPIPPNLHLHIANLVGWTLDTTTYIHRASFNEKKACLAPIFLSFGFSFLLHLYTQSEFIFFSWYNLQCNLFLLLN